MKFKIKRVLPFIGIGIFLYLVFKIGIRSIINSFASVKLGYLALSLVFVLPIVLIQAWKWYIITRRQRININFIEATRIQFISLFYGFITPARLGTFIKVVYLQEKTKNFGKSVSSVLIDRMFDLVVVLIFAAFGSLLLMEHTNEVFFNMSKWMFVMLVIFALFSFSLISKNTGKKTLGYIYEKILPKTIKSKTRHSFENFYASIPKKRYLIVPFLLTIIAWFLIYSPNFFIAKALGIEIPYITFTFLLAISTIIAELPITISGLGIREAALITMFKLFNISPSKVISLSIISIIIVTILPSIIGFFLSLGSNVRKRNKP